MNPFQRRFLLLVVALAGPGASAAEAALDDLRLVVEARPTAFSFRWDGGGVARSGDDAFDRAWGAGLGWRHGLGRAGSPHLLVLGVEALWIDETFGAGGRQGPLARLEAGWGHALANRLLLTATAAAGTGWSAFAMPGGVAGDRRMPGWLFEGGPRLGLRWSPDAAWSLIGEAGWLLGRDRHRDGDATLVVERSGGWFALGAAWTLDAAPRPVE